VPVFLFFLAIPAIILISGSPTQGSQSGEMNINEIRAISKAISRFTHQSHLDLYLDLLLQVDLKADAHNLHFQKWDADDSPIWSLLWGDLFKDDSRGYLSLGN
jgi:hypothetical protein